MLASNSRFLSSCLPNAGLSPINHHAWPHYCMLIVNTQKVVSCEAGVVAQTVKVLAARLENLNGRQEPVSA